ncbi:MAG: hypothetical protein JXR73_04720 [Candidatus Omnitrophica bacterium]|nr:hypothetical protein [Candidatus Omnitrophota bacterium]
MIISRRLSSIRFSFFFIPFLLTVFSFSAMADSGRFVQLFWYEQGIEHGNPKYNGRFRVNSPETVLSDYKERREVRANGMMQIQMEEDPSLLEQAELYLEVWGGHPGTANKRVIVNGRSVYPLPRVGTESKNCTHQYPTIPLKITDLVNGYNVFQFACDQGSTFWGHFIIENACLRAYVNPDHPSLLQAGLEKFHAELEGSQENEIFRFRAVVPREFQDKIDRIDFQGRYRGYDENGNTHAYDWHGFTKNRQPVGFLGQAQSAPFSIQWDASMIPDQTALGVRAMIYFKDQPGLMYITPLLDQPIAPERRGRVRMYLSHDIPRPFWSRAGQLNQCTIDIDASPQSIQQAELHVILWDGGRGEIENPFTLNGHPLPAAGTGAHDVLYSILPIDPSILKQGANIIEALSDTEHHGIEILLPGPALIIRIRP